MEIFEEEKYTNSESSYGGATRMGGVMLGRADERMDFRGRRMLNLSERNVPKANLCAWQAWYRCWSRLYNEGGPHRLCGARARWVIVGSFSAKL